MKKVFPIFIIVSLLISCGKKTASDIIVSKIKTPCEWLTDFEIVINEYQDYLIKAQKKFEKKSTEGEFSKKLITEFENKSQFYDSLLDALLAAQKTNKWNTENGVFENCKKGGPDFGQLKKQYDRVYEDILPNLAVKYTAELFLKAVKEKNYDQAKSLSNPSMHQILDMMKSLGQNFDLLDVKEVKCKIENNSVVDLAKCTFCCSADTNFKLIELKNEGDGWLVFYDYSRWY